MKSRKAIFGFAIFCLTAHLSRGQSHELVSASYQSDPTLVSVATPHAASLGSFGRIPVDLYNGQYNLSIPLYSLPVKGYPMDIKLSYRSGGIKPSEKGGTVGVGWALAASGSITRIQNGTIDEHTNQNYTDSLLGFYFNQSEVNAANWDSLTGTLNCINGILGDGNGGSTIWHDWAPDEFAFNFYGYSGSFWLDNTGHWVIRESSGEKMTIKVDFGPYSYKYPTAADSVKLKYCFQRFTISDGAGNTFVFGGDPNSIEFNRTASDIWPSIATSWWLTQVITSHAEKVNFTYQRIVPTACLTNSFNTYSAQVGSNSYGFYNLCKQTAYLQEPVYLQSIAFNTDSIKFSYTPENIFYYSNTPAYNPATGNPSMANLAPGQDLTLPSQELNAVYATDYKLSNITVAYSNYSRLFNFTYYDSSVANRLFLKTLSTGPAGTPLVYQFSYNGTHFSNYGDGTSVDGLATSKTDHWGYYTGLFPFKTSDLPQVAGGYYSSYNTYPSQDFLNYYYNSRAPQADSMKVGSLSQVIYPTGGYTNFIYEPNDYSLQLDSITNQGKFLGTNYTAGGLRVKEVDSYTDPYSAPFVKKYKYINDNGYSSGVLNSAGIRYGDSVSGTLSTGPAFVVKYFGDNNVLPLAATNPVTYTRVDEISSDSSHSIYRYANQDNGHYDLSPPFFVSGTASAYYWRKNSSRAYQRGKLLSQTGLDSSRIRVSFDTAVYLNDDSITSHLIGVRAYDYRPKDFMLMNYIASQGFLPTMYTGLNIMIPNINPYINFVHYYPQVKKTTTYYKSPDSLQTMESYQYDTSNNKVKVDSLTSLSDGSMKITNYVYPVDITGNSFYSTMAAQHIIDPVVQRTLSNQSGKILQVEKDSLMANTVKTASYYWLYEKDVYQVVTDITKSNILAYDSAGDPVNVVGPDGIPVCYLWDYQSMHPVAITKGANNATVAYTSFEAEGSGNWSIPDATRDVGYSMTGIQSYDLTSAKTISATVTAGQTYILSYWARSGAAVVKANGAVVAATLTGLVKNGWTYYEYQLPNTTSAATVTGASGTANPIDELRLYPSAAQMTTYTYSPLCGVTSICSPANNITYYFWDNPYDRLLRIQDMDGNIVKQYDYNYQRLVRPVFNQITSGNFQDTVCGAGYYGSLETYVVQPGKYSSYISQSDANAQAQNEVNLKGQHYADSVGVCYVSISCNNSAGASGFTANFTPWVGGNVSHFSIPSSGGFIGFLPAQKYHLTITNASNTTIYTFGVGCQNLTMDGTSASFNLDPVSITCNVLTISFVQ